MGSLRPATRRQEPATIRDTADDHRRAAGGDTSDADNANCDSRGNTDTAVTTEDAAATTGGAQRLTASALPRVAHATGAMDGIGIDLGNDVLAHEFDHLERFFFRRATGAEHQLIGAR